MIHSTQSGSLLTHSLPSFVLIFSAVILDVLIHSHQASHWYIHSYFRLVLPVLTCSLPSLVECSHLASVLTCLPPSLVSCTDIFHFHVVILGHQPSLLLIQFTQSVPVSINSFATKCLELHCVILTRTGGTASDPPICTGHESKGLKWLKAVCMGDENRSLWIRRVKVTEGCIIAYGWWEQVLHFFLFFAGGSVVWPAVAGGTLNPGTCQQTKPGVTFRSGWHFTNLLPPLPPP